MPVLAKPRSDRDRLELLERAVLTSQQDGTAGRKYLLDKTSTELEIFIPIYRAATLAIIGKKGKRILDTTAQKEAFDDLKTYCRDMMNVAKRRIYRLKQPLGVLAFYMINQKGEIPNPTNMQQWLNLAESLVQGDADAVKAGYPTMLNPDVTELQAILDTAQAESDETAMADREHDIVQETLATHRVTADEWINEIYDELNFALRKFDASSQRRIIRTYGFRYDSLPSEEQLPAIPENFNLDWQSPNLNLTWNAVTDATTYHLQYSLDETNWLPLYSGAENSFTYELPQGKRSYRLQAENEYGIGEWSEIIWFEPVGV